MKKRIIGNIILSILTVGAVAALALLFTNTQSDWYTSLQKPSFQPPAAVFGIVWSAIYALYAASLTLLLSSSLEQPMVYLLYALMGLFNILWCLFFFTLQMPSFALIIILLYIFATVFSFIFALKQSKAAAFLLIPSMIWLLYATALNIGIIALN